MMGVPSPLIPASAILVANLARRATSDLPQASSTRRRSLPPAGVSLTPKTSRQDSATRLLALENIDHWLTPRRPNDPHGPVFHYEAVRASSGSSATRKLPRYCLGRYGR